MVSRDEVVGRSTGKSTVTIERGPISKFAVAITDKSPVYQRADAAREAGFDDIPAPPIYFFSSAGYWGAFPDQQPPDAEPESNPTMEIIGSLMAKGGMVLHGEQEFTYHRPVVAGMTLSSEGSVVDLYEKPTGDKVMTFLVTETEYRDADGELVVTSRMNLIHRS